MSRRGAGNNMDRQACKKRCTAVVLAAGNGSRMKSAVAKQYLPLGGRPLIWYALRAVEDSEIIDDCILVTGAQHLEYARCEIVQKYGFHKVDAVISGGEERCLSVARALEVIAAGDMRVANRDGYVFIHDGARPFLTEEILRRTYGAVREYHACVAAMPVKDTVKIADGAGFAADTPDRRRVWTIQTPQVFDTPLILNAYGELKEHYPELAAKGICVTDDAGAVELFTDRKVKLVEGSYENIKITTPEDLRIAEAFLRENCVKNDGKIV